VIIVTMPTIALHPRILYRNTMHKATWRGNQMSSIRKSLPSTTLLRSVEARFVILPIRFDLFSVLFSSCDWFAVVPSTTEAVSGVDVPVEGRLEDDSGGSDFIRIRRACSNTSWVMIPWV
jgi:hypothetical protein